jgi:hypothetical protein
MWVSSQRYAPAALPPGKLPIIYCTGRGGVNFRAGLDMHRQILLPPEFQPRNVQPLSSRATDYTTSTAS